MKILSSSRMVSPPRGSVRHPIGYTLHRWGVSGPELDFNGSDASMNTLYSGLSSSWISGLWIMPFRMYPSDTPALPISLVSHFVDLQWMLFSTAVLIFGSVELY